MYDYTLVHNKIVLLHQLGIIRKNDRRIRDIQDMLYGKNETQIDNWVHDIIVGNKTLDEKLYRGITL